MNEDLFVICAVGVSLVECVAASILSWSIVFGIGQALEFFGAFVCSPLALVLVVSAAVGLLFGIAFRNRTSRWGDFLVCITILHGLYFGVSWFYAIAVSHF